MSRFKDIKMNEKMISSGGQKDLLFIYDLVSEQETVIEEMMTFNEALSLAESIYNTLLAHGANEVSIIGQADDDINISITNMKLKHNSKPLRGIKPLFKKVGLNTVQICSTKIFLKHDEA